MAERSVIVHLRGNAGDGPEVSRRLHEAGLAVREFGDAYSALGFLVRARPRAAALVIDLSALGSEDWELPGLARRFVPPGAICGYGRGAGALRGPSGPSMPTYPSDQPEQLDAMMSHLRARAADPTRQNGKRAAARGEPVEHREPRGPGEPGGAAVAGTPPATAPGVEPAPPPDVSTQGVEEGSPSAMSEGDLQRDVPFPWSPARDLPRRRPPGSAKNGRSQEPGEAGGDDADEPILTQAELRALLGEEDDN